MVKGIHGLHRGVPPGYPPVYPALADSATMRPAKIEIERGTEKRNLYSNRPGLAQGNN